VTGLMLRSSVTKAFYSFCRFPFRLAKGRPFPNLLGLEYGNDFSVWNAEVGNDLDGKDF
jgi:hypothetical protein